MLFFSIYNEKLWKTRFRTVASPSACGVLKTPVLERRALVVNISI